MKITDLSQALRIVRRYSVSTRPGRFPVAGTVWTVRLDGVTFRTTKGREIKTHLWVPCGITDETIKGRYRQWAASTATRRGQHQLAAQLVQVFTKQRGFPGVRGWFQCVELVSVYDPRRRRIAVLDEKKS